MLDRFKHTVEELRGLIADSRSASPLIPTSPSSFPTSPASFPTDASSFPTRSGILLAVSGGIDSMCLADLWLRSFGPESFAIAHCNFHLRGEESDGDQALVVKWADEKGVRMHCVDFDTAGYAAENGLSIEMAARELRYRWFGKLCEEHGYEAVAVAHHADDNAETLVLNMVRGAGLKGLTGMKPISPLPLQRKPGQTGLDGMSCPAYDGSCQTGLDGMSCPAYDGSCQTGLDGSCHPRPDRGSVPLLRPLLAFTRKQIEGHVFAWKVPYREDSTNSSVEYRRNSIRHEVFPIFGRMNPSYVRTFNREMKYLTDASSIVEEWCLAQLPKVISRDSFCHSGQDYGPGGEICISTSRLLEIPQWRYLLYYILEPYGFNASVLESIENLMLSDRTFSGKRFESDGYVLRTERQGLAVVRKMAGQAGHDVTSSPVHDAAVRPGHDVIADRARRAIVIPDLIGDPFTPVRTAGVYHCNGRRFRVEVLPWSSEMPVQQPSGTLILDAGKLKFPFVLRGWRNGDWMIPLGMRGKKKLSDMFTDLKYSYQDKKNAIILVDCSGGLAENGHVAAVAGLRIDDRYKVTKSTDTIIRITDMIL